MIRSETPEKKAVREQVLSYIQGWKHGATASAQVMPGSEDYLRGYRDGSQARIVATHTERKRAGVSVQEMSSWVLR